MAPTSFVPSILLLLLGTGTLAIRLPFVSDSTEIQQQHLKKEPWFCHHHGCPKYSVITSYDKGRVELRAYKSSVWVSTRMTGTGYDSASRVGFTRLVEYFSGENKEGIKLNETVPVKINCSPDSHGPFCKRDFTVSFMIPLDLQDTPPAPKDDRVFLETVPAADMYVLAFDKWIDEWGLISQASDFKDELDDLDLNYDKTMFYSAVYDPPETYSGRHNELWVPAVPGRAAQQQ